VTIISSGFSLSSASSSQRPIDHAWEQATRPRTIPPPVPFHGSSDGSPERDGWINRALMGPGLARMALRRFRCMLSPSLVHDDLSWGLPVEGLDAEIGWHPFLRVAFSGSEPARVSFSHPRTKRCAAVSRKSGAMSATAAAPKSRARRRASRIASDRLRSRECAQQRPPEYDALPFHWYDGWRQNTKAQRIGTLYPC
jgi:hypothetical protein